MKTKTDREWMHLARQHSKTMTIDEVKELYGALPEKPTREEELETFIQDAVGFMIYGAKERLSDALILETLSHDIMGLFRRDICFSPRVTGYHSRMKSVPADQKGS